MPQTLDVQLAGLVQRYHSFVRCRQNAFFMECSVPVLVLTMPDADGSINVQGYRGQLSAEHVYEWVKRSQQDSSRLVEKIGTTAGCCPSRLLR